MQWSAFNAVLEYCYEDTTSIVTPWTTCGDSLTTSRDHNNSSKDELIALASSSPQVSISCSSSILAGTFTAVGANFYGWKTPAILDTGAQFSSMRLDVFTSLKVLMDIQRRPAASGRGAGGAAIPVFVAVTLPLVLNDILLWVELICFFVAGWYPFG